MLTDAKCRNATCAPDKARARFTDATGLYLEVSPAGSKRWFWKMYLDSKESRLALGSYPDVSLTAARKARDAAKLNKSEGRDPVQLRKVEKLRAIMPDADTFKVTALEWYELKLASWSNHYAIREKHNLEKDLFPHFAAIADPLKLGELIRVIRGYQGGPIVRAALQLAPLLFQRPGELRAAAWAELDLDAALWTIPAARMKRSVYCKKNGEPHLVPLPTQAVEILRKLHPITGHIKLCFFGGRSHERPISDNTLRAALLTLGHGPDKQSVHGLRATARTLLAEVLDFDPLVIEVQLAHAVKDANGRAYNRTTYMKHRAEMMEAWADYLNKLAKGADVIELKAA